MSSPGSNNGGLSFGGQASSSATQQTGGGTSLFGTPNTQNVAGTSAFGGQQVGQFGGQTSGGGLFGATQQQQSSGFGFPQQQPVQQQQRFGFSQQQPTQQLGFGQQQPQSFTQEDEAPVVTGITSDVLKWVAGSNGSIPEGAVEGGWCSATQEHYYIARAKDASSGGVYPGYVLPSKKTFCYLKRANRSRGSFGGYSNEAKADTNPNYEVLVNLNEAETLSWVLILTPQVGGLGFTPRSNDTRVPKNSLEAGYTGNGSLLFIGRTCGWVSGDIVPGYIHNNVLHYIDNDDSNPSPLICPLYEVLCVTKKDEASKVKSAFLYNIEYSMEGASVNWSRVPLERSVFVNKSSREQSMSAAFQTSFPTTFKWAVDESSIPENTEVEIKGSVPSVFGGNKSHRLHLLNGSQFLNIFSSHAGLGGLGGFGGGGAFGSFGTTMDTASMVYGGTINTGRQQFPGLKKDIFVPTIITMSLSESLQLEKTGVHDTTACIVPPTSRIVTQKQGVQYELSVPFKATLKIIYANNHVEDKEIEGSYQHSSIKGTETSIQAETQITQS